MRKLWFKAKHYGWGWYPCSWEGWLITLLYILGIALIFGNVDYSNYSINSAIYGIYIPFILWTAILLEICWKTGERPRWRWGK